ncbi:MAG: MaoC family dehydratase N-terminal domain-containing protein [Nevskia sp.]|nr:MaoC family dehydratase N-terminal domain-containing protein [Nevskia sp.]
MAIDRAHVGYSLPAFTVVATPERIARFRAAIGETGGDIRVAPPTFMKMVEGEHNSSRRILDTLAVDLRRVLHAEQQFDYLGPILAGDQLGMALLSSSFANRALLKFDARFAAILPVNTSLRCRARLADVVEGQPDDGHLRLAPEAIDPAGTVIITGSAELAAAN